jgi:hypothetical protein
MAQVAAAGEHVAGVGGGFGTGQALRSGHDHPAGSDSSWRCYAVDGTAQLGGERGGAEAAELLGPYWVWSRFALRGTGWSRLSPVCPIPVPR